MAIATAIYLLGFMGAFIRAMELSKSWSTWIGVAALWPVGLGVLCADRLLMPGDKFGPPVEISDKEILK